MNFIFKRINIKDFFNVIITADDTDKGKPNPEIFLKAAEKLNIAPADALVFEDAKYGVEAAKNGAMKCIAITSTNKKEKLHQADLIIDKYSDLDINKVLSL